MISKVTSAIASTACTLPLVVGALTTHGLAQGSLYTPDVEQYGTASGQVANPSSYVQMFGFPTPGQTIELQLRGAPPGSSTTFYVSNSHANNNVSGVGRILVDLSGATSHTAMVDAQGNASVSIVIPANTPLGSESYVQCLTRTTNQQADLSQALYFEVGETSHLTMQGTVDGSLSVSGPSGSSTHPDVVSGIYSYEWTDAAGTMDGFLSIVTQAAVPTSAGLIADLVIQSNGEAAGVNWGPADFLQIPNAIADQFLVSYSFQGTEYGPYVISAATTADASSIHTQLQPLPVIDGGPLDGMTFSLNLVKTALDTAHFDEMNSLETSALTTGTAPGMTGADIEAIFDRGELLAVRAINAAAVNQAFYTALMPTYAEFVALEAVNLLDLTNGAASNVTELTTITSGTLMIDDQLALFIAKLLAAAELDIRLLDKVKEALEETLGDDWKKFRKHAKDGKWKKAGKALKKMLKKMVGKEFTKKLIDKVGKKKAAKIVAKLASKAVPVLGWGLFAVQLLWAYVEQIFSQPGGATAVQA